MLTHFYKHWFRTELTEKNELKCAARLDSLCFTLFNSKALGIKIEVEHYLNIHVQMNDKIICLIQIISVIAYSLPIAIVSQSETK